MFALKPAALRDIDRCTQRLSNEMAGLAVIGCVPVLGLVLKLQLHGLPVSGWAWSEATLTLDPCHGPPLSLGTPLYCGRP